MKKRLLSIFLAACLIFTLLPVSAFADTTASGTCGDNLTWELDSDGKLTISGEGAMEDYYSGNAPWDTKAELIEKVVIEDGVTIIGSYAFYGCSNITNVTLPSSVISIGNYGFYNAISKIENVYYDGNIESWLEINFKDFGSNPCSGSNLYFNGELAADVVIPDSVTSIGNYAFYKCRSLEGVAIPDSVTSVGNSVFYGCSNLTSVTLGNGVTNIGDGAFNGCSKLTSVTIGNGVTSIGGGAFNGCSSLESVTIPDSVTSIGKTAFYGCSSLENMTIPNGVTTIESSTFYNCSSLASVTIGNGVTLIGSSAFYGCSGLTSVAIPDSVASIRNHAFDECSSLSTVNYGGTIAQWEKISISDGNDCLTAADIICIDGRILPHGICGNGLTWELDSNGTLTISGTGAMENNCFENNRNIKSLVVNEGVTSIGSSAFFGCSGLTSAMIADSVTGIRDYAFSGCSNLTRVAMGKGITSIGNHAFDECSSLSTVNYSGTIAQWEKISISDGNNCLAVADIICTDGRIVPRNTCGDNLTWELDSDGTLTISGTGKMWDYNWDQSPWYNTRDKILSVVITAGVTRVGRYAFHECNKLTNVTMPDSVTSIGDYAFSGCSSLTSVTIPDSVTSIGYDAFSGCSSLTSVTIPDSVKLIRSYAFYGCNNIKNVYYNGDLKSWLEINWGGDASSNPCRYGSNLYFNGELVTDVAIPDDMTMIGDYAFCGCDSLTSVTIPNSVTSVGRRAFSYCRSLESVMIPDSVTGIGDGAFCRCYSLLNVAIPNSVTDVGWEAFAYCRSLTSVMIADGVKNIGDRTFYGCSSLNNIELPSSVTSVGNSAFSNCSSLNSVKMPNTVRSIGYNAFENCTSLTKMSIPKSVKSIGRDTFSNCGGLTSVTIPDSVASIDDSAFNGCGALTDIAFSGTKDAWKKVGYVGFAPSVHMHYSCSSLDGHYIPIEIDKADCTSTGQITYLCSCGYEYTETLPNAHDYVFVNSFEPTCSAHGYDLYKCSKCGTEKKDYKNDELKDHRYTATVVEPTCATGGYTLHKCSVCGQSYKESLVEYLGHSMVSVSEKAATCTEAGCTAGVQCSRCGEVESGMIKIPALGHNYSEWTRVTASTCTEAGTEVRTCSRCDVIETRAIDALGHTLVHHDGKAATCTEKGWEAYDTCSRCDYTSYKEIPATGHNYIAKVFAPTCTVKGYTTYTCSECGDSYIDDYVDSLGHDRIHHEAKAATCTEIGWEAYDTCSRCDYTTYKEIPATDHDYNAVVTAPTCTEKGYTTHTCTACGDSYVDSYTDALGHELVHHDGKAATCTEKGWAEYDTCNRCDYTTYKEIPASGHNYIAKVFAPTCTVKGYTTYTCSDCGDSYIDDYVDSLGHDRIHHEAKAATCTEIGWEAYDTCSRCDYTTYKEIPATGHHYDAVVTAPTCTEKGYTTHTCACGDSYVDSYTDALGHSYGAWKQTKAPTCTEKGMETRTCTRCNASETRDINALGHDIKHHAAKTATCTEKGWAAYDTCSRCDYTTYKEIAATGHDYDAVVTEPTCTEKGYTTHTCAACGDSYVDSYTDALGHTLVHHDGKAATCTEKGWEAYDTCSVCDYTSYKEIPATGHDYIAKVFAPTCTVKGYTTYTCSDCGDSYIDDYVDSLGHDRIHHEAKAATCTEIGWEAYDTCSRCNYTTYEEIAATGHNYNAVVTAPTCTEKGYTTHTCTCGESYVDSYTDALDHDYGAWKQTKAPTCTAKGTETRTCTRCNASETRDIASLGHDTVHHEAKAATCTEIGWEAYDTCSRCDYSTYKEIAATGHKYTTAVTAPTCTAQGYTTHTCTACGNSYKDSYTNALGHNYENGKCARCGAADPNYKPTPSAPTLKITTVSGHPKISWNAVDGAVKYWVYRSTDGKTFKYYDSTTKTTYTNNSTTIGTTYYYKVKAVNVVDGKNYASAYSVSKSIQCKPAAPTVSINRSNGKPKLSWKAVSGATKYWIYRSTDGVNFKYWDSTTKTSYTNSGAASGTKYYYRVKAVAVVNGKNIVSANSSTKSLFTSLAKPSVSITTSNGKPKLTWKAVTGADKYYIYRSTDGKTFNYWDSTTKPTYVNSGAKKNTKYYYKVKAVCASNSNANSAQSSTVSIKATR